MWFWNVYILNFWIFDRENNDEWLLSPLVSAKRLTGNLHTELYSPPPPEAKHHCQRWFSLSQLINFKYKIFHCKPPYINRQVHYNYEELVYICENLSTHMYKGVNVVKKYTTIYHSPLLVVVHSQSGFMWNATVVIVLKHYFKKTVWNFNLQKEAVT